MFNEIEDYYEDKKNKIKTRYREDIKRGLYYVEKMNNKIKKEPNECKGIKYIRYLFNEDKKKKTNLYKTEKNEKLSSKNTKGLNEYKGIKDIRYLFNDNIYKGIIDIRYLFNEDYYVKKY